MSYFSHWLRVSSGLKKERLAFLITFLLEKQFGACGLHVSPV